VNTPEKPFQYNRRDGRSAESATSRRHQLLNGIVTKDWIVKHPAGSTRMLEYPVPENHEQERYRDALKAKGVILGIYQQHEPEFVISEYVVIPKGARLLKYDSSSSAEGDYSFNDNKLFYELGELFTAIDYLDPYRRLVVEGPLENKVALTEFTRPSERALWFVPGIEHAIISLPDGHDPIDYYVSLINETFANQFELAADYFQAGYMRNHNTTDC